MCWRWTLLQAGSCPTLMRAVRCWIEQHEVCARHAATFDPPHPDSLIVISAGVAEGDPVQAVRYPSPAHMSGWWITTDRYDGDVQSLTQVHAPHVAADRPDLSPLLALPCGYRFDQASGGDAWLDERVVQQSPP